MKKTFLFISAISFSLYANEPSAYGAGDLNSPNPYGLTQEEAVLLETKKNLQKVEVKTKSQENKVNSLRERIDGLQSIIEGLAKKSHQNKLELQKLTQQFKDNQLSIDEYEKRVEDILTQNTKALQDLNVTLHKEYVSKSEFLELVDNFNRFKKLIASQLSGQYDSLDKKSKAQILKEARRYYDRKYYTKAIKYYKYLLLHNYKPARSAFMLGEMYYYRKKYVDAIAYFKESAKRYSKASYMPTLLLHTAVAMKKTGDKKTAQKFLKVLIKKYPSSKEAKSAKKYLK